MMQRNIDQLAATAFDVLIIGGGVYGAAAAWDATLRGLSVGLVERGDFGGETSANSQKIAHGGLRYLQSLDIARMRESVRERATLLRIAPHLVMPLPCLMPTVRFGLKSRAVMAGALWLNDRISFDRNRALRDPATHIPDSRVISRQECLRLIPTLRREGISGGAVWYDGQILNTERLTLTYILGSVLRGAQAANYVCVTELIRESSRITGVKAVDMLTGRSFNIQARVVLNTAGPWVSQVLESAASGKAVKPKTRTFLKAINLITRPVYNRRVALGVASPVKSANSLGLIFITPWRDRSIIGTAYSPYQGRAQDAHVSEDEIRVFLKEINAAFPQARLIREDVSYVHFGLLPAASDGKANESKLPLRKHYELIDHKRSHGLEGLITVLGVKYTTARDVAERAIACALKKLNRPVAVSPSGSCALPGGDIERIDAFISQEARAGAHGLSPAVIRHLIHSHGTLYRSVLAHLDEDKSLSEPIVGSAEVIRAEIRHAVRYEMAQHLADVILRRTDLGSVGHPGEACLRDCADLMAQELGWNAARVEEELKQTRAELRRHACVPADVQAAVAQVQVKMRKRELPRAKASDS